MQENRTTADLIADAAYWANKYAEATTRAQELRALKGYKETVKQLGFDPLA